MRRPRHTARTAVRARLHTLAADAAGTRAILTLALASRGVGEAVDAIGHPWARLVETLLLAILALGFFAAARRCHEHRGGWLLSGAAAGGLAIASCYEVIASAPTSAMPAAALAVCIVLVLLVTSGAARRRLRHADPAGGHRARRR
jgi:peptidoglycan/LPS O-acetylase OafA/YrhL